MIILYIFKRHKNYRSQFLILLTLHKWNWWKHELLLWYTLLKKAILNTQAFAVRKGWIGFSLNNIIFRYIHKNDIYLEKDTKFNTKDTTIYCNKHICTRNVNRNEKKAFKDYAWSRFCWPCRWTYLH